VMRPSPHGRGVHAGAREKVGCTMWLYGERFAGAPGLLRKSGHHREEYFRWRGLRDRLATPPDMQIFRGRQLHRLD